MAEDSFAGAQWIARPVPAAQRIIREIRRSRIDWAEPGHSLSQTFTASGPVVAVNLDLSGPRDADDPHRADVLYSYSLETPDGEVIASRRIEGPKLVWDYFDALLDVDPPAPPGEYVVVLRPEREAIGWWTADAPADEPDDGISPRPVVGVALADGVAVPGVRAIGVDTLPAPNPVFHREFELSAPAVAAELAAVALGAGVVRVNGTRVGDEMLEPAVTDYDTTVLYRSWDVAHLLRVGRNVLTIEAGRERYAARGGDVWGWSLAPWHREPIAIARLDVHLPGGHREVIVTDEHWSASPGTVVAERLFRGEDWVVPGPAADHRPARVVDPPRGVLKPADHPPVTASASVAPSTSTVLPGGAIVHDFGTVMVGRVRCRVRGEPGAVVRVISGEQRSDDGSVVCDNFLVAGEAQLDTLTLDAPTVDFLWEPQFGYRGFRWMQVETEGSVAVDQVRAVPLVTQVDAVGAFSTDEPVIEWIDGATARTFRNNLHGIPTDTPIYEKNGWTADAHLATEALLHHLDLRSAFGKWLDDHADAQRADGSIPQIIPTPGWGLASDPAWSASAVLIPWYLYREYGDLQILERAAPMVRRFADHVLDRLDGGIWRHRSWSDWLSPGFQLPPEHMAPTATIMAVTIMHHTALLLRELGDAEAERFEREAEAIGRRYHDAYFDDDAGVYRVEGVGYRQAMNILPLAFRAVPVEHVAGVREGLIRDLEDRTGGHLDCGAVGVRHLLPVLSDAGRDDLAITVLTRRTRPGWGAWFDAGETTLLESWDVDARSRNHYFLGSVDAWIQQRVGGMRLTEAGWRSFEIAPVDDERVTRASIRHETPRGAAAVAWQRGAGGWRFAVEVPSGSEATIRAAGAERSLSPGAHVVTLPS